MTLSSVSEGFVLLRNLWEYNSILKYRYKKRKAYKVATMKHLSAPQAKECKPNLAVRLVKAVYNSQVDFWNDVVKIAGSLVSKKQEPRTASSIIRNYKTKYPEQYDKLMGVQTMQQQRQLLNQPQGTGGLTTSPMFSGLPMDASLRELEFNKQSKCKFKVGDIVYYKDSSSIIHRDKVYKVQGSGGTDINMVRVDNVSDSKDKWWLSEKDLDFYVNKQEVNEKRIRFLPLMPSNYEG